jgi:tripartite-type tricarboxylate transporter receptor subunit TctC
MKKQYWLALAFALTALATPASAQTWPNKTVTIVAPFAAGSGVDLLARHLAEELRAKLGQSFIVENRVGANGNLGAGIVAKATPDGNTLLIVTPGIAVQNKFVYKTMPYDFGKDFDPIVLVAKAPMLLLLNPKIPAKTMPELIAYAKANPGRINVSSTGVGSQPHVTLELIKQAANIEMTHIPYNSTAQQNSDLISGHTEAAINYVTTTLGLASAGQARALAITSATRIKELPDVPTLQEAGFKDFEAVGWYGIFAPHGSPPEVAARINPVINAWLKTDAAQKALGDLGMTGAGGTSKDLTDWITKENGRWSAILQKVIVPQ